MQGGEPPSPASGTATSKPGKPGQHLLKHEITAEIRQAAIGALGEDSVQAGRTIWDLRQPELRQMFSRVFGVHTASGNNGWMRGKLLQAVGLPSRWHPDDAPAAGMGKQHQQGSSPAGSHGSQPGSDAKELRKRGRQRQLPARLQQDSEESAPRVRPAKKKGCAPSHSGSQGGGSSNSGKQGRHGSPPPHLAGAMGGSGTPTIVLMMGPGAQLPMWAGGQPGGQALQAGGWGQVPGLQQEGPLPQQQVVVLQQQGNDGQGHNVEQAALAALQALGCLPPGAAAPQSLMPATLGLPPAGMLQQPAPDNMPLLLQPGQVSGLPWPIVLAPGPPVADAGASWEPFEQVAQQQQPEQQVQGQVQGHNQGQHLQVLQQQQQEKEQQLLQQYHEQRQQLLQQFEEQRQQLQQQEQPRPQGQVPALQMPPPAPRLPAGTSRSAGQPLDVRGTVAANKAPAPSPFAELAAKPPLSAPIQPESRLAEQSGQQKSKVQAQEGGDPSFLNLPLLFSGFQPDPSLFAGVEALGWSASFATLSADLHSLFQAWQDGRVSLSLPPPPPS